MRKALRLAKRIVAVALTVAFAATMAALVGMEHRGAHPPACPDTPGVLDVLDNDGFPEIDWDAWKQVNPDIIGWITIPGTSIDLPIVRAPRGDPQYYLAHDVHRLLNYTGCPYLDSECVEAGGLLKCPNSIVFGHNMGWNRDMFADLARYSDGAFARNNRIVLLQTPEKKMRLQVQAAAVVPGWSASKRTEFLDAEDFNTWWKGIMAESDVKFTPLPRASPPVLTLCTCSYNYWSNERTLVYCVPEQTVPAE